MPCVLPGLLVCMFLTPFMRQIAVCISILHHSIQAFPGTSIDRLEHSDLYIADWMSLSGLMQNAPIVNAVGLGVACVGVPDVFEICVVSRASLL